MEAALLSLLSVYGLLSAANQIQPVQDRFTRLNRASWLPYWSFFAPIPGTSDHRVLRRSREKNLKASEWGEVDFHVGRRWFHLLWNPDKHLNKCVTDCVSILLMERSEVGDEHPEVIQLSWSYLKLAQFALQGLDRGNGRAFQFAIVESSGALERSVSPQFISNWHAL